MENTEREPLKVFKQSPRGNLIYKTREENGAWVYRIDGRGGEVIACIRFGGQNEAARLTNADLLEIVRDRLLILKKYGNERSEHCAQHVEEALFWANAPSPKKTDGEETAKEGDE